MSVTVYNNTNAPINVVVSAGVNYDWRNRVLPGEFVVMDKFLVGTLSTRWYFGESTEYGVSGIEIGFFVAGTVLGVVGLILAIPSAGASLALTAGGGAVLTGSGAVAYGGLLAGTIGSAVGGIAFAAKDFANAPAAVTGVSVLKDLIYSVDGHVTYGNLEHGVLKDVVPGPVQLRELSPSEFIELKARPKSAAEDEPVKSAYVIARSLDLLNLINGKVWIYPSYSGTPSLSPACWTPAREAAVGERPMLLRDEKSANAEWFIVRAKALKAYKPDSAQGDKNFDAVAHNIYNPALDVYAAVSPVESDSRLLAKKHRSGTGSIQTPNDDPYTLFFIIQTANCYSFVPVSRNSRGPDSFHLAAVVNRDGAVDNGAAVDVGQRTGPFPGRARWVVERIDLEPNDFDPRNGDTAWEIEQLLGWKFSQSRFRIVPALVEGNRLQQEYHAGWKADSYDAAEPNPHIVLGSGDSAETEWRIEFRKTGDRGDLFTIYSTARQRYATVGGGNMLNLGGSEQLFYLKYAMGFFCIRSQHSPMTPIHGLYALGTSTGSRIRVGGSRDEADAHVNKAALAKWALVPSPLPAA